VEEVSSYWMALRKKEDTRNWKRKHQIKHGAELALKQAKDLS
jgi:hypothetical protein